MSYWIDSHAHIVSKDLVDDFDQIVQNAKNNNIQKICVICGNLEQVETAIKLVDNDPMFDLAIGVHPSDAKEVNKAEFDKMMTYLDHPQVKFIGEIGLDYYWDQSFNTLQKEYLIKQIQVANEHNLPIIIHIRESKDDVYEILKNHPVNRKGIVHCYTEDLSSAQGFVDLGYYIGIGGIVTFKNGDNIRTLVENLPFNRILSETDSPYLAPVPKRGKRNEPANVQYVGEAIAKLKHLDVKTVQEQLIKNYQRVSEGQ